MTRSKYLLAYLALLPLSIALLVICNFFYQGFDLFGTQIFSRSTYEETNACADSYWFYLDQNLSRSSTPQNYPSYERIPEGDSRTETIYYNFPSPATNLEFILTFYLEDRIITYTNRSEPTLSSDVLAENTLYYVYDNKTSALPDTNVVPLYSGHTPNLSVYYMTEPISQIDHPDLLHYKLQTWLIGLPEGNLASPNMLEEKQLFQFLSTRWVPLAGIALACMVCLTLLLRHLGKEEKAAILRAKGAFCSGCGPSFIWREKGCVLCWAC